MSEFVKNGTSSPCRLVSLTVGSDGGSVPCSSAGPGLQATISVVDRWTKSQNISPHCHTLRRITVARRGFHALKPWKRSQFLQEGVPLGMCSLCKTITTDASLAGWGAVHSGHPIRGVWTDEFRSWHTNSLEQLQSSWLSDSSYHS